MDIKTKIIFVDFDSSLCSSPLPETGKDAWAKAHGKEYPHIGWWGKEESLCLTAFDIKPIESVLSKIQNVDPSVLTVLLTNRVPKMESAVKKVLTKNGIRLDYVTFKMGRDTKAQRIAKFLERYHDVTEVDFFDDMAEHFEDAAYLHETYPSVLFNFFLVTKTGEIKPV